MLLQRAAAGPLWALGLRAFSSSANDYTQVLQQAHEISRTPEVAASSDVGMTAGVPLSTYQRKARVDVLPLPSPGRPAAGTAALPAFGERASPFSNPSPPRPPPRQVRIFSPARAAAQSGTANTLGGPAPSWKIQFETTEK
jgi:hypothetical protein